MNRFILLFLFCVNTFASIRVNVPNDWFRYTPKKLFNKSITIYAPKANKNIKVTHQVISYKPFYQNQKREQFYQCQTNAKKLKTNFEEYTINKVDICFLKNESLALVSNTKTKELHSFKFSNFKGIKEVKLFFKGLIREK